MNCAPASTMSSSPKLGFTNPQPRDHLGVPHRHSAPTTEDHDSSRRRRGRPVLRRFHPRLHRPNVGQMWPRFVQIWGDVARIWSHVGPRWANLRRVGPSLTNVGRRRPSLSNLGWRWASIQHSGALPTELGPMLAVCGANPTANWTVSNEFWLMFAQFASDFGQYRPRIDKLMGDANRMRHIRTK